MLKIEIIKFEAQDVITTSTADPKCSCPDANFERDAATRCRYSGHPQCEFKGADEAHECFTVN